jgi:hypothetical protein
MTMKGSIEERTVFAIAPQGTGDGVPLVVLGIPLGAWKYIREGKTNTFDLTKGPMPIPVKIMIFGGMNHAEVKAILEKYAFAQGAQGILDETRGDFRIDAAPQFKLIDAAMRLRDLLIVYGDTAHDTALAVPDGVDSKAFTDAFRALDEAITAEAKEAEK